MHIKYYVEIHYSGTSKISFASKRFLTAFTIKQKRTIYITNGYEHGPKHDTGKAQYPLMTCNTVYKVIVACSVSRVLVAT